MSGGGSGQPVLRLGADSKYPNAGYLKLLEEFGYPHDMAVKALLAVHNESLEHAIEWLDRNRDTQDTWVEPASVGDVPSFQSKPAATTPQFSSAPAPVTSFVNDDLRPDGLSRSKLEADRKKHAEYKRQLQIQEEKEKLKRQQEDARIVREKYAQEKAEKARQKAAASAPAPALAPNVVAAPVASSSSVAANADVVIQVKVPNGPPVLIKGLIASSTLSDLYARVDAECKSLKNSFVLTVPFPPPPTHLSRIDAIQLQKTLRELGLAPRAALVITEETSLGKVSQGVAVEPQQGGFNRLPDFGGGGGGGGGFNRLPDFGGGGGVVAGPVVVDLSKSIESRFMKKEGVDQDCFVCQNALEDGDHIRTLAGCMHIFHAECIEDWIQEKASCPLCDK